MENASNLEEAIYNCGERLIPGVTHNIAELIRHKSTYAFFKKLIEVDIAHAKPAKPVKIVDLGCGTGHGCFTLAEIPGSQILGVDLSKETIEYAKTNYVKDNISYQVVNLPEYISNMPEHDYIVSRHVFEHLQDGLQLALHSKWRRKMMFEVPYNEPKGNSYHLLAGIREGHFSAFTNREFFFQDLQGFIYNEQTKPLTPNGIICVTSSVDAISTEEGQMKFPMLPPIRLESVETVQFINEYRLLQQSKALIFARELGKHPFLLKVSSAAYRILAKIHQCIWRK